MNINSTVVPRLNNESTYKKKAVDYKTQIYPLTSIVLMFFSFSSFGWILEVALELFNNQSFANRGVLHGAWLPIYGVGGVLMLLLLKRFQDKPLLCF